MTIPKEVSSVSVVKNPVFKTLLFLFGWLCVVIAVIGVFLPVLPTTPLALLAAWCFFKSSPKTHGWLLRQPYLGTAILDWQNHQKISRKTKIMALLFILVSLGMIWLMSIILWLKIGLTLLLSTVSMFIATRKE